MLIDLYTISFINNIRNPFFDMIMPKITWLGNYGLVWIAIAGGMLINRKFRKAGAVLIFALLLCTLLGELIIKHLIQRPRPFMVDESLKLLINRPKSYSFPSGHTASSFVVLTVFLTAVKNKYYTILIAILTFSIAFSRIYLNVHYLTDVLGGIVIGVISAIVAIALVNKIESKLKFKL